MRRSSADLWKGFVWTAGVIVAALFSVTASATTLEQLPTTINYATHVVTIGVRVLGAPDGDVAFVDTADASGRILGLVRSSNGEARVDLVGLSSGPHLIAAHYFGDRVYGAATLTFTIYVGSELGWLPTVLDLLTD